LVRASPLRALNARMACPPGSLAWTGVLADASEYIPVFAMLLFAISFAAVNLGLSWILGRKAPGNPVKDAAYECGMPPITDAHQRFSVKFYLVALLFVLFDIEVVFLYPWAVRFGHQTAFLFGEMVVFLGILFLGWLYVIKKGAVDWAKE
jgi:NADH-quinone oxidoreductase subunit A